MPLSFVTIIVTPLSHVTKPYVTFRKAVSVYEVYPYKNGGRQSFSRAEGGEGTTIFVGSFITGHWVLAMLKGHKMFPSLREAQKLALCLQAFIRGANIFRPPIFPCGSHSHP